MVFLSLLSRKIIALHDNMTEENDHKKVIQMMIMAMKNQLSPLEKGQCCYVVPVTVCQHSVSSQKKQHLLASQYRMRASSIETDCIPSNHH